MCLENLNLFCSISKPWLRGIPRVSRNVLGVPARKCGLNTLKRPECREKFQISPLNIAGVLIRQLAVLKEFPAKLIDCYTASVDIIKRISFSFSGL